VNPRIVLYAEGGAETGSDDGPPPTPGSEMGREQFGVAHILIQRVVAEAWAIPLPAIGFVGPLRHKSRVIRGSQLLDREVLRQALTFASPTRKPDFAVVLIDADGEPRRKEHLEAATEGLSLRRVIGCAAPEFEGWLLGDHEKVRDLFGAVQGPASIEDLGRREAKELLNQWTRDAGRKERDVRMTLAATVRLEEVGRNCPAFACLVREIGALKP
jgi:hypothetical protein